jgi:hypothetical protein
MLTLTPPSPLTVGIDSHRGEGLPCGVVKHTPQGEGEGEGKISPLPPHLLPPREESFWFDFKENL